MATLNFISGKIVSLKDDGTVNAGGKVYFYVADGTYSSALTSYSDRPLTTPNANPLVLDSSGRGKAYISGNADCKITDSADVLIYNERDISPQNIKTVSTKSANFTVDTTYLDSVVETTAALTLSLTSAATLGAGFSFTLVNTSDGTVTVARLNSGDTINGVVGNDTIPLNSSAEITVNAAATGFLIDKVNISTFASPVTFSNSITSSGNNTWTGQNVGLFSTGDVKLSIKTSADAGWVIMDDGTIGNASSSASTRANADTAALFSLVWDNIANTWCPIYDSAGAVSTRGADAATDYAANKRIRLPRTVGRAMAGAGSTGAYSSTFTADAGTDVCTVDSNLSLYTGAIVQVASTTTLPAGLSAATNYYVIRTAATTLTLATSLANAHAGTAIDITDAGTGTHTMTMSLSSRALGEHVGEETHVNIHAEGYPHSHSMNAYQPGGSGFGSVVTASATTHSQDTSSVGAGNAANNMPPETFLNVMIKL